MPTPTNVKTTPQEPANREDLHDTCTRIYADLTPFVSSMGTRGASAVDHEWTERDIRQGQLGNARAEAQRSEATAPKNSVRLANRCQIFGEGISVSATQAAVDTAGIPNAVKDQKDMKMKEVMLDKEVTYLSAQQYRAEVGTNQGDGRLASGVQCFATVAGNTSRGAGGADGTIVNKFAEAPTPGTDRPFVEQQLKDVLRGMFINGCVGNKPLLWARP